MQVIEQARPHASWKSFFPKRAELDCGRPLVLPLVLPRNELPPNGQLALLRQPTCADPTRRIHLRSSAAHRNFLSFLQFPSSRNEPSFPTRKAGQLGGPPSPLAAGVISSTDARSRDGRSEGGREGVRERGAISTLSAGMLPPAVLRWRARQMT